ncbi:MAG: hypothetical protein LJE68_17940 [Rhodobacter sp.]|nr:hypothetical protein [Rhodobacter sp.]
MAKTTARPAPQEYQIGALWIGGALSFLEQLCLISFVDAGHNVKLFTYGEVENIPDRIEVADANDILAVDKVIRHSRTGSPAPQADRFRYHLLAQTDDIIWADTDAYCVKPFATRTGHFYGWESPHHVNNGVLGLPRDSDTLQELLAFTSDEFAIPEWLPQGEQDRLKAARDAGQPIGVGDQEWGAWGPRALTYFLHKTGEIRHALPREALYPIGFRDRGQLVRPDAGAERFITHDTLSIHFFGRRIRERIKEDGGVPHERSLIGQLLTRHGVDPAAAPLPKPPPRPVRLTPEERHGRGQLNLTDLADTAGSDRGSARHRYTELYHMLFQPMRQRKLEIVFVGLDCGIGVTAPEAGLQEARKMAGIWLEYFPKAQFTLIDRPAKAPLKDKRLTYVQCDLEDPAALAEALKSAPDIVLDDATHASHHQQNAIRALFPQLASGGLYLAVDLRSQPAELEHPDSIKTAALFQDYLDTGIFKHPDPEAQCKFNDLRAEISGCFLFQANFQKRRRDQMLVLHKR